MKIVEPLLRKFEQFENAKNIDSFFMQIFFRDYQLGNFPGDFVNFFFCCKNERISDYFKRLFEAFPHHSLWHKSNRASLMSPSSGSPMDEPFVHQWIEE